MIQVIIYAASCWILGAYFLLVAHRVKLRAFHFANAFGGLIILVGVISTTGWIPALTLTVAFTISGGVALLLEESRENRAYRKLFNKRPMTEMLSREWAEGENPWDRLSETLRKEAK